MTSLVVNAVQHSNEDGHPVRSAGITVGNDNYEIWYRTSQGPVADGAEAFLASMLLPAMKRGGPLRISGEVTPRLVHALPTIQDIFHKWCPELHKVIVESEIKAPAQIETDRPVASFFSGGVDSYYTLFKHRDEITHLIFLHGFDIVLENRPLLETVAKAVRNVAAELKKELIEIETNIRVVSDQYNSWTFYHGPALASAALLLAPQFKKIYIPSSHSYSQLFPWGSHPVVDHLWSTEEIEIVHDGCEASRVEKVLQVASCDIALRTLRVCWENPHGAYNCGECEKCLRTMVSLRIAGVLDRCETFDRELDMAKVAHLELPDENARAFMEENLQALVKAGNDPALTQAVLDYLTGRYHRGRRERLHQGLDIVLDTLYPRKMRGVSRRALTKFGFIKN